LQVRYGASERQVCFALRLRIREITGTRVHYGYRRVHVMLRREGWCDNHKRIYRLYSEQGFAAPQTATPQ